MSEARTDGRAALRPSYGVRAHTPHPLLMQAQVSGWTDTQLELARELRVIANRFRREGHGRVPDLAMLAVIIQESSLNPAARGDDGQSYGPFQIYQVAHPDTWQCALDPWSDYAYGRVCFVPWETAWNALGGDVVWADLASRGDFIGRFASRAQGSIPWPAGLGRVRYVEAVSVLELIS